MMNYEEFKKAVVENFKDYVPQRFKGMALNVIKVSKVNEVLDGMVFKAVRGVRASPTIYLNAMYEKYVECEDFEQTLRESAEVFEKGFDNAPVISQRDFINAKDNIVFQLVNTSQNVEMLKTVPHREIEDLSVIYRWMVGNEADGIASAIVRYDLMNMLGLSEEELFEVAKANSKRLLPAVVRSMNEVMEKLLRDTHIGETVNLDGSNMMYVITNSKGVNGAGVVLYENVLEELSEKLDADLYILPSSTNEMIAVSTDEIDIHYLADMVYEINMTEVNVRERLSNQVYIYDRKLKKLSLATDTENKSLEN